MLCLYTSKQDPTTAAVIATTTTIMSTATESQLLQLQLPLIASHSWYLTPSKFTSLSRVRPAIAIECASTVFTVMASKSGNAQALVISVCETGLAGCFVLTRFLSTSIL